MAIVVPADVDTTYDDAIDYIPYEHRIWCIELTCMTMRLGMATSEDDADCVDARQRLDQLREHRRNQPPEAVRRAAEALGYTHDPRRGKGSHQWMRKPGCPPFAIPQRTPMAVGTLTSILRTLEKVYDDVCEGSPKRR